MRRPARLQASLGGVEEGAAALPTTLALAADAAASPVRTADEVPWPEDEIVDLPVHASIDDALRGVTAAAAMGAVLPRGDYDLLIEFLLRSEGPAVRPSALAFLRRAANGLVRRVPPRLCARAACQPSCTCDVMPQGRGVGMHSRNSASPQLATDAAPPHEALIDRPEPPAAERTDEVCMAMGPLAALTPERRAPQRDGVRCKRRTQQAPLSASAHMQRLVDVHEAAMKSFAKRAADAAFRNTTPLDICPAERRILRASASFTLRMRRILSAFNCHEQAANLHGVHAQRYAALEQEHGREVVQMYLDEHAEGDDAWFLHKWQEAQDRRAAAEAERLEALIARQGVEDEELPADVDDEVAARSEAAAADTASEESEADMGTDEEGSGEERPEQREREDAQFVSRRGAENRVGDGSFLDDDGRVLDARWPGRPSDRAAGGRGRGRGRRGRPRTT